MAKGVILFAFEESVETTMPAVVLDGQSVVNSIMTRKERYWWGRADRGSRRRREHKPAQGTVS